jgi:transcriptional regulator with XRE-family HTH domain
MLARSPAKNNSKPITLGQKIAAKRNSMGISQNALGNILGIAQSLVSAIERDARKPDGALLRKISEFLNNRGEKAQEPASKLAVVQTPEPAQETHLATALRLRNEMLALIESISPTEGDASLDAADERIRECYLWIREYLESK